MVYILIAILIFGVLIAVHELGHFLAAKLCGGRMKCGDGAPGRAARRNFHFAMLVPVMQSVGIMHPGWKILKNGRFRAHFQHVRRRH